MAQFFFHFSDGESLSTDDLGLELASSEQAFLEAVAAAQAMWPELLAERRDPTRCAFEIANAAGEVLFRLPFAELVETCRPPVSRDMHRLLHETHLRAQTAREEVRCGLLQVRESLEDFSMLVAQFSHFEGARHRKNGGLSKAAG